MEIEDYKGNSNRERTTGSPYGDPKKKEPEVPKKDIPKVVQDGSAKTKKRSRIADDASKVWNYILNDILIPNGKKALFDIITGSAEISLFGDAGKPRAIGSDRIPYRSYYSGGPSKIKYGDVPTIKPRAIGYEYEDIVVADRRTAEQVISTMEEMISSYGQASVADLYEMVDIPGKYTDNNYGWTDVHSAAVIRVMDGYLIKLPKAMPLN